MCSWTRNSRPDHANVLLPLRAGPAGAQSSRGPTRWWPRLSERPARLRATRDHPETLDGQRSCGIRSGPSGKVKLRPPVHPLVYLEPATAVEAPAPSSSQLARPWSAGLGTRDLIMQTCSCRFAPGLPGASPAAGLRCGGLSEQPAPPLASRGHPETSCGIRSGPSGKVKLRPPVHPRVYVVAPLTHTGACFAGTTLGDTVGSSPSSSYHHVGPRLPCDSRHGSGALIQPARLSPPGCAQNPTTEYASSSLRSALASPAPTAAPRWVRRSQPSKTSDCLSEPATAVEAPAPSSSQLARPWAAGLGTRDLIMQTCSCRSALGRLGPPAPMLGPVVPTIYDRRLTFGACKSCHGSCALIQLARLCVAELGTRRLNMLRAPSALSCQHHSRLRRVAWRRQLVSAGQAVGYAAGH
jgi:hypothetical protein